MSHNLERAVRTAVFPALAAARNLYPGSVKEPVDSPSPNDVWLSTGRISKITVKTSIGLPLTLQVYDYKDSNYSLLKGGTSMGANNVTAITYDDVTKAVTLTFATAIPDRQEFSLVLSGMTPADLDGHHTAHRQSSRSVVVFFDLQALGGVGVSGSGVATVNDFGRLTGTATAAVQPGRTRDGVSENLFDCHEGGALPTGLSSTNIVYSMVLHADRTIELEPEVVCVYGMVIRLSGATDSDVTVSYAPRITGGARKSNFDTVTEFSMPMI